MNNKNNSYIEMVKKIDETFPLISKFDYRNLSVEEMWNKVYALISEIGLLSKMDPVEIQHLESIIHDYQNRILDTVEFDKNNSKYTGYKQDNFLIGECVLRMKSDITSLMKQKNLISFVEVYDPNSPGYLYEMGSDDEIKKFIERDSIYKYVQEHMLFSKNDQQKLDVDGFLVLNDICNHFGLEPDLEFRIKFHKLFSYALEQSEDLTSLINEVVSYVEDNANKALDDRIKDRKSFQEESEKDLLRFLEGKSPSAINPHNDLIDVRGPIFPDNNRFNTTPQDISDETGKFGLKESVPGNDYMVDWARPVKPDTSLNNSPTGIAALQNNIIKNQELQRLIQENEAIIGQIRDLTTRMEENLDAIKGIYHGVK